MIISNFPQGGSGGAVKTAQYTCPSPDCNVGGMTSTFSLEFTRAGQALKSNNVKYGVYAKFYLYSGTANRDAVSHVSINARRKGENTPIVIADYDVTSSYNSDGTLMFVVDTRSTMSQALANLTDASTIVLDFVITKMNSSSGRQENNVTFILETAAA